MRADIEKYLQTVMESTAKTIASRLGLPQLDVSRELNGMVKDGTLEREMKKGEYAYWLTRGEAPAVQSAPVATFAPIAKPEAVPVKTAAEEAFAKLSEQTSELLKVLGLPPYMSRAATAAREMLELAKKTAVERDELRGEVESLKAQNAKLRENTTALERSIDDLTGVADVQLPKVYVTVGKYAKPCRHADLPRAQRRAAALVRNEKESEVLVLAPVGRMVRGSEWRSQ